jgi:hypothetical protein
VCVAGDDAEERLVLRAVDVRSFCDDDAGWFGKHERPPFILSKMHISTSPFFLPS